MSAPLIHGVVESRLPARLVEVHKGLLGAIHKGGEMEGLILQRELQHELDSQGRSVNGDLRKSVNYQLTTTNVAMLLTVMPGVEYAPYVELGTKPHWAPIEPLIRWVHNRGLVGRYSVKTKKRLGNRRSQFYEDWDAASRIQFSIAKRGTKAHPFVAPVFEREQGRVLGRFNTAIGAALQALNHG